jgi:ComF family protein
LLYPLLDPLVSILFPAHCDLCQQLISRAVDSTVCDRCWAALRPLGGQVCTVCGDPLISTIVPAEWRCGRCRRGLFQFDFCRSFALYEGTMREVLHRFKYGGRMRLGQRLAHLLFQTWSKHPPLEEATVILPMPLHRGREKERGFNQSRILAKYLSGMIRVPLESRAVARVRNTPSQTGLSHRQRRLNVAGCFEVRRPAVIRKRTCLIVDDVFTTGATLNEMARALKEEGAERILALTLARVSPRAAIGTAKKAA